MVFKLSYQNNKAPETSRQVLKEKRMARKAKPRIGVDG
jgi:hypothetical protein